MSWRWRWMGDPNRATLPPGLVGPPYPTRTQRLHALGLR